MTQHRQRREQGLYEPTGAAPDAVAATNLDAMTKPQLLDYAQQLGVSPANAGMTKEELRAGVDAKLAGGA